MTEENPLERQNVQRQLAIFDVARRARGKDMTEIRQMLRDAFARRRLPPQPGPWMDAAASEASYGEPYIVSLPAAVAANAAMDAPDPQVQETLTWRRRLRKAEDSAGDRERAPAAVQRSGEPFGYSADPVGATGTGTGLRRIRIIVAASIALTLAVAAAQVIRALIGTRPAARKTFSDSSGAVRTRAGQP